MLWVWSPWFTELFCWTWRKCHRPPSFPILDIYIRFEDIRTQSGKGSEIKPNLPCFGPKIFWTRIIKLNTLLTMWQNFAAIRWGTSEILCWKKRIRPSGLLFRWPNKVIKYVKKLYKHRNKTWTLSKTYDLDNKNVSLSELIVWL